MPDLVALGTLGTFVKGRGLPKAKLTAEGIPCLRYAEIYTKYGDVARSLVSRTSEAGALASRALNHGDIVFAASGETAEEIGKAVAYVGTERAVVGSDTVVLTGHRQNPTFLAYAINYEDVAKQKAALGKGHSVVHIHAPDLAKLLLVIPPLPEQRRIAAVLGTWDCAIATAEGLVDAFARRKRGIAFALFGDGHNPFTIDGSPLEELATFAYGRGVAPADYRQDGDVWVIGTQGLMALSTKAQQHGPVIIVGRKGTLNRPIYVPPDQGFAAIDTTFVLRAVDPSRSRALFHYLRYIDLAKLNEASGVPSVSADTLRSLPIPPLEERQSDILDACDIQLGLAQDVVKSLRLQKRGLMQQLLTGQLPVPARIDVLLPAAPALDAAT